ncbi:hypothetical protein ACF0H5_011476 [Mactra antiquata]
MIWKVIIKDQTKIKDIKIEQKLEVSQTTPVKRFPRLCGQHNFTKTMYHSRGKTLLFPCRLGYKVILETNILTNFGEDQTDEDCLTLRVDVLDSHTLRCPL